MSSVYYSLNSLKEPEKLLLSNNKFCNGLPDVVSELITLNQLELSQCNLSTLPDRLVEYLGIGPIEFGSCCCVGFVYTWISRGYA